MTKGIALPYAYLRDGQYYLLKDWNRKTDQNSVDTPTGNVYFACFPSNEIVAWRNVVSRHSP